MKHFELKCSLTGSWLSFLPFTYAALCKFYVFTFCGDISKIKHFTANARTVASLMKLYRNKSENILYSISQNFVFGTLLHKENSDYVNCKVWISHESFEVLAVVTMGSTIFWDLILCSLVMCLVLAWLCDLQGGSNMFFFNLRKHYQIAWHHIQEGGVLHLNFSCLLNFSYKIH